MGAHLVAILLQRGLDVGADGGVLLAELGRDLGMVRVLHHAQQVVVHQHLRRTQQALSPAVRAVTLVWHEPCLAPGSTALQHSS